MLHTLRRTLTPALTTNFATAVGSLITAVLMTWPLASYSTDHILGSPYYWDAYTNTMIMGGRVDALLGRGPLSFYDNYFFAPLPDAIVFNENLFGLSLLFAPFYLLGNNPLLAYNLTLLVSMALSVFFTALLVRRLTTNSFVAFAMGVAFACCPYVLFESGRLQLTATQWIPACFLFLHRAIEGHQRRDAVALWVCYLLQIGTCLYYAMFLIPLLGFTGALLLFRHRPPRRVYATLGVGAAVAGVLALGMVYPYFAARDTFDLERTLSFASSYDGKLSFLGNVHPGNRTLTALHHQSEYRGAHEEIAFPGLTVTLLALAAIIPPVWRKLVRGTNAGGLALRWSAALTVAVLASLFTHSMLSGGVLLGGFAWRESRAKRPTPFSGSRGLYMSLWLLAVVMFLGLEPLSFRGEPVHGLYYYFHTYFPGFNGIRKVSRQAVMTTFVLVVVAGHGGAWLFSHLGHAWQRWTVLTALTLGLYVELCCFPHALKGVWAGANVPAAYAYLREQPEQDLVAAIPQQTGTREFRGDHGLALHNYLMLYHGHRSLNGQSSWEPSVTNLVNRALTHLPDDGARRILQSVGTKHLLIHGAELDTQHSSLPAQLTALPLLYQHAFESGSDHVFTFVNDHDPSLALAETPELPSGARLIPSSMLQASANLEHGAADRALDGNPKTYWSTRYAQAPGQGFQLTLDEPRAIAAIEIDNAWNPNHVPMSYELAVASPGAAWQTVVVEPKLRVPHDLVYAPKRFVFRAVLPAPVVASRVRLTIRQPVPGAPFTVHEARLYDIALPTPE